MQCKCCLWCAFLVLLAVSAVSATQLIKVLDKLVYHYAVSHKVRAVGKHIVTPDSHRAPVLSNLYYNQTPVPLTKQTLDVIFFCSDGSFTFERTTIRLIVHCRQLYKISRTKINHSFGGDLYHVYLTLTSIKITRADKEFKVKNLNTS
ncbi:hypothetical protein QTP88_012580 [Uroleucon formosanum]